MKLLFHFPDCRPALTPPHSANTTSLATAMLQEAPLLVRMPQGRQALGLGLVVAAGLLYVASGFAIKALTDQGVSPFLVSYISSCLFMLHLPCPAIARWWRGGATSGFQELVPKDKTSDQGGSPQGGSPRRWQELASEGEETGDVGESGYDWEGGPHEAARSLVLESEGGVENGEETGPNSVRSLPLVSSERFGEMSGRNGSEPQTPIVSALDEWRAPTAPVELADLSGPREQVTAGKVQPRSQYGSRIAGASLVEKQDGLGERGPSVEFSLQADKQGRAQFLGGSGAILEAVQWGASKAAEPGTNAYPGLLRVYRPALQNLSPEHWEAVKLAAAIGPLWFVAQYVYTSALTLTTVSVRS